MPIQDRNEKLSRGTERVSQDPIATKRKQTIHGTPLDALQMGNHIQTLQGMAETAESDPTIRPTLRQGGSRGDIKNRPSWMYHEPTVTAGAGTEQALQGMAQAMADPRFGMAGGLAGAAGIVKAPGWGAEVLRRYKLLGGTPETLNRTLTNRAVDSGVKEQIIRGYRLGTDIAAPPSPDAQLIQIRGAGAGLDEATARGQLYSMFERRYPPEDLDNPIRPFNNRLINPESIPPEIESATQANAAYGAVSRQAGRIMDQPGFGFRRPEYGPAPIEGAPEGTMLSDRRALFGEQPFEWGHGPGGLYEQQDLRGQRLRDRLNSRGSE